MGSGRVIGIGGVFLKSKDRDQLRSWYANHLGIELSEYGAVFKWRSFDNPAQEHLTAWDIFPSDATDFDSSKALSMINYIVDDLDALLARLSEAGVKIDPKREDYDYGRFAWIYDADGNRIELWEPSKPS